MAAIGTIRKYSAVAVGFIFVAILAFIVTDAFQSGSSLFGSNKMIVGEIAGEKISYQDFQTRYDIELDKYMKRSQKTSVDESTREQLREELWQKLQDEIIYENEYSACGIAFSAEELTYQVSGPDPHSAVKSFFTDPKTQQFSREQLVGFLKNMDEYPEYKEIWLDFENELGKEAKKQKFFNLIKSGFYTTSLEAKEVYYNKNKFASFEYVSIPLRDVADSLVTPTESEMKKYYSKHKKKYKTDDLRNLDFVFFEVFPSKNDTLLLLEQLKITKNEFKITDRDSLFVEANSDERFDTLYHNPGFFGSAIDNVFFAGGKSDSIIGPYFDKGYYKIAKLVDKKSDTVYYYRASHILIKPKGPTNKDTLDAMNRARELMAETRTTDFAELAMRNSDDKGSGIRGGDLEWFKDGAMVKPFMDAVKKMKKGQMVVVKSEFGAHLIKLTGEQSNTIIKVAVVAKRIEPSPETFQTSYAQAVKFRSKIKKAEDFDNVVREMELNKMNAPEVRPIENDLPGLPGARAVISWAYREKKGTVSDIISIDNKYVVAVLLQAYDKGVAPYEKVVEQVKGEVSKEKKQEYLYKKLNEALKENNSLEKIAKALNTTVEKVSNASFEMPFITGLGEEKLLMGYIFGSEKDKLSKPIKGENAVFVYVFKGNSEVEAPKDLTDIKKERISNLQSMSQYMAMEAMKEISNIQDWRYKFF